MIDNIVIGIMGVIFLMLLWVAVQRLWGDTFSEHLDDEDVMAGRTQCGNCGCLTTCQRNKDLISHSTN